MKVRYEFVNGEISEIEVDDNLGELLVDFDRQEYNNDHKETRRHTSLDGMEYEGEAFLSPENTEEQVLKREDMARLLRAMEALTPAQRELVRRVYFENEKISKIAREEGVSHVAIHDRLKRIYQKIYIIFNLTLTICLSRGLTVRATKTGSQKEVKGK